MKKFAITISILITLVIAAYFYKMESSWKKHISIEEKNKLVELIQQSPEIPDNFTNYYKQIHTNSLKGNLYLYQIDYILGNKERICPCLNIFFETSLDSLIKDKSTDIHIVATLDNKVKQTDCYNYLLNNYRFNNDIIGIHQASNIYFNKEVSKLEKKEVIELIVIMINPALYNRDQRPTTISKKVDEFIEKVDGLKN